METKNHHNNKKFIQVPSTGISGFTLIELLVVIAIIGLLASIVLVSVTTIRAKSRDAKRVADLNQMAKAFEMYMNDNRSYPTVAAAGVLDTVLAAKMVPTYVGKLPAAPTPADGLCTDTAPTGPGTLSNGYYYEADASGANYTVSFCLGAPIRGGLTTSGSHYLTGGGFK